MKFETSPKPLLGISVPAFLTAFILIAFLYYFIDRIITQQFLQELPVKKEFAEEKKVSNEFAKDSLSENQSMEENRTELQPQQGAKRGSGRELGFDLDFGTGNPRIVKTFILPQVSNPGSGRVILKFKFVIRPDGSVAKVFPKMKSDPDLEIEAMNILRKWRFEKLSTKEDQIDQNVEISFRPQ